MKTIQVKTYDYCLKSYVNSYEIVLAIKYEFSMIRILILFN